MGYEKTRSRLLPQPIKEYTDCSSADTRCRYCQRHCRRYPAQRYAPVHQPLLNRRQILSDLLPRSPAACRQNQLLLIADLFDLTYRCQEPWRRYRSAFLPKDSSPIAVHSHIDKDRAGTPTPPRIRLPRGGSLCIRHQNSRSLNPIIFRLSTKI